MNKQKCLNWIKRIKFSMLILIILFLSLGSGHIQAAPEYQDDGNHPFEVVKIDPEALEFSSVLELSSGKEIKPANPKIDSSLTRLAEVFAESRQSALTLAESLDLRILNNKVQVQVVTEEVNLSDALRIVASHGGEVTVISLDNTRFQAWLPVDQLDALTGYESVYYIRQPMIAVPLEDDRVGSYTTEGVAVMNADSWHTAGIQGSGVKVAIIDGGFQGYLSLLGTDLPFSVTVKNFVDGQNDADINTSGGPHGLACSEIVYDISPQAQLFLAKISTDLDLQEAVTWAITNYVDVISTSIGWYNLTPGDGTGFFANLVQTARDNGILWATAASNDREAHWGGAYTSGSIADTHYWNTGQNVNYFGPGGGYVYSIPAGYLILGFLRWDDWTNVDQDYDLYLVRWNGSSWQNVAASENYQTGSPGQTPTEFAAYVSSGASTYYGFVISRWDSTRNVNFEFFAPKIARLDEIVYDRSLANLADAPSAMTVAALDVNPPYPQESYSSQGPTNGPGGTAGGGFTKPDISGFANVSTQAYGATTFNGTSSATPHVAGAAALVLSAYPGYNQNQIQDFLETHAVDMGSAGMDNVFGYGRLFLGDPPEPTDGAISGTVTYSGARVDEDNPVTLALFVDPSDPPYTSTLVNSTTDTYPYTFSDLPYQTYYVGALMDLNANGEPDPNEPFAWYDVAGDGFPDPVVVSAGNKTYTNIDFMLYDPSSISGTVNYVGELGIDGPILVSAHLNQDDEPVATAAPISSGYQYTIEGLPVGIYYISAFLDIDEDGGPPKYTEPLSWYDADLDGEPDSVQITGGQTITDKDITLEDRSEFPIFLPLIMR